MKSCNGLYRSMGVTLLCLYTLSSTLLASGWEGQVQLSHDPVCVGSSLTATLINMSYTPPDEDIRQELKDSDAYIEYEYDWSFFPGGVIESGQGTPSCTGRFDTASYMEDDRTVQVTVTATVTYDPEGENGEVVDTDQHAFSVFLTAVEIESVGAGDVTSTTDDPGEEETLYVCVGEEEETIIVTATSQPGGIWPVGKPTWSGWEDASQHDGNPTAEFPVDVVSGTAGGTTITATCGTSSKVMKIVVVGINIFPNSGPLYTPITIEMEPEALGFFSDNTTISATGRYYPEGLTPTAEITIIHSGNKIYFHENSPDVVHVLAGEAAPGYGYLLDHLYALGASSGNAKMDVSINTTELTCIKSFEFILLPQAAFGTIVNGQFSIMQDFQYGKEMHIQVLIPNYEEIIEDPPAPPGSITVTVQSYDSEGNIIEESPPGKPPASHQVALQRQDNGPGGSSHTYWSVTEDTGDPIPIVIWPIGSIPWSAYPPGTKFIYNVDGFVRIHYHDI